MSIPNSYPGASYPVKPAAHGKFHRLPFFDIVPYLYKVIAWAVVGLALSALSAYGRDVPHCRVPSPPLYEEVTPLQSRLDELDLAACIPLEVGAERE
ncbi:MAG: hypothetical protein ACXVBW_07565, partial [Bdellovibrionota bacterium]